MKIHDKIKMKDRINILKWIFQKRRLLKELNDLREHNRKLSETKMVLDQREKMMILDAICCDEYKSKVQNPATPTHIRQIYRGLLAKFRSYVREER